MASELPVAPLNGTVSSEVLEMSLKDPKIPALTEYNSLGPELPYPCFEGIPKNFLLSDGYPDYLRLILTSRVYDITQETPLTLGVNLSTKLGVKVLLKREDLHPVFSFKIRGAYNKMAHIPEDDKWKGVVACSAGISTSTLITKERKPCSRGRIFGQAVKYTFNNRHASCYTEY